MAGTDAIDGKTTSNGALGKNGPATVDNQLVFDSFVHEELSKKADGAPVLLAQALPLAEPGDAGRTLPRTPARPSAKILPFRQPGAGAATAASARATAILGPLTRLGPALTLPLTLYGDTPRYKNFKIEGRDFFAQTDRESSLLSIRQRTGFWSDDNVLAELETKWSAEDKKWTILGADGQVIGTFEKDRVAFIPEALEALDIRASMGDKASPGDAEPGKLEESRPEPALAPQEEQCTQSHQVGQTMPPTQQDIDRLVAEHSRDKGSPALTRLAAWSIAGQTQPPGTRAEIVGEHVEGPDIYYHYAENECDENGQRRESETVQVKAIAGWNGFNNELSSELGAAPGAQSRIIAFQVPEDVNPGKWMGRYWGNRMRVDPGGWAIEAAKFANREVLIVDPRGVTLFRGPVFDPSKAK